MLTLKKLRYKMLYIHGLKYNVKKTMMIVFFRPGRALERFLAFWFNGLGCDSNTWVIFQRGAWRQQRHREGVEGEKPEKPYYQCFHTCYLRVNFKRAKLSWTRISSFWNGLRCSGNKHYIKGNFHRFQFKCWHFIYRDTYKKYNVFMTFLNCFSIYFCYSWCFREFSKL